MCRGMRAMTSLTSRRSIVRLSNFLIVRGKSKSSLHGLTSSDFSPSTDTWLTCLFSISNVRFAFWAFFENRKNSGLTPGQNDDPVTRWPGRERWPKWPIDPVTQWPSSISGGSKQAIVMSTSVCLSVWLCVLSLREHIFGTTHPIFTTFVAHVNYGRGSVLLRQH